MCHCLTGVTVFDMASQPTICIVIGKENPNIQAVDVDIMSFLQALSLA
jgi:hypothetical protein